MGFNLLVRRWRSRLGGGYTNNELQLQFAIAAGS